MHGTDKSPTRRSARFQIFENGQIGAMQPNEPSSVKKNPLDQLSKAFDRKSYIVWP